MEEKCPLTGLPCLYKKTIHITDISKESVHGCDVCQSCGSQSMLTSFIINELTELFTSIKQKPLERACGLCGTTLDDISKFARIGCPNCYEYFKAELLPVIQHVQKSIQHCGKRPTGNQLEALKAKVTACIKEEKYEEAAELKKQIDLIKSDALL